MSIYSEIRAGIRHGVWSALESRFPNEETAPVLFSYVSGGEPDESYVAIHILSVDQIGHASTSTLADTQNKLSTVVNYDVTVQVSFCGSMAGEMALDFNQAINTRQVRDSFRSKSLGIKTKSNLRRIPQKRETKWVDFWNMDMSLTYAVNTIQVTDVVENFSFEGEVGSPS